MRDQFSSGGRRIDILFKAHQVDAALLEVLDDFEQLLQRPAKAVEARDAEAVAGPGMIEQLGQGGRLARVPETTSVKTRMAPTPMRRSFSPDSSWSAVETRA